MSARPIVYEQRMPVRFADLDPYGHVNASVYLDYIVSSRWSFARQRFGIGDRTLFERGVGFYMTRADMSFLKPIIGMQELVITSYVTQIQEARLLAHAEIKSSDEGKMFSRGTLEFVTIDLATTRPTPCPDWVRDLFIERIAAAV